MTTWVTGSGIHHFAAQSKMASISEEFSGDCFDFDRLSASSLGGSVIKREQKEAGSRSREDFSFCGSISAPQCIFKRIAGGILSTPAHSEILNRFFGRNVFGLSAVITDWNFEINATNRARIWICGLCAFLQSQEIFSPALIRLNLLNALNRFPWPTLTDLTGFFSREEIVNWFDQWRRQISATPFEHETEWSCYSLHSFFFPAMCSTTPTHEHFELSQFHSH